LGTNAWQSMNGGGVIQFSVHGESIDAPMRDLSPGRYAVLRVIDNGVGMDKATCDRIFEPFFTTKRANGGTGLGLSVVHGIVRNHGGAIAVDSRPNAGATFIVHLPEAREAPSSEPIAPPVATNAGLRVLYIDDEQQLVQLVSEQLTRRGHCVHAFASIDAALAEFRRDPNGFDLVICDYNMPAASGLEAVKALKALRADLPCIVISGHIDAKLAGAVGSHGIARVLQKPVNVSELCAALDAVFARE
jgi:CheY-like chemotaxis protein